MTTVTVKPTNVASFPEGGGHFWVFANYVDGLRQLGHEVFWLERFDSLGSAAADRRALRVFADRMAEFGLADRSVLYQRDANGRTQVLGAERPLRRAAGSDILLNFDYAIEAEILEKFSVTALVDIDPGLLQFWVSTGQLELADHDLYLTTGETVGTARARFSDLGRPWINFRPPVSTRLWPFTYDADARSMTTISGWWGGNGKGEWITDGESVFFENNKRVTFLDYRALPSLTSQSLELALAMGEGDEAIVPRDDVSDGWSPSCPPPEHPTDYVNDEVDRQTLERHGWRVRQASVAASSPSAYRDYIQASRGEFSCAKPSCMYFQNAWVSDRTLCYLASGKPAIVQDTGPSTFLPSGEGILRFSGLDGALAAIEAVNENYRSQCEAARELATSVFDAPVVLDAMLSRAFAGAR